MSSFNKKFKVIQQAGEISEWIIDSNKLFGFLERFTPIDPGPQITEFQPFRGYAGTSMVILGNNFSNKRQKNIVKVGGHYARVVECEQNRLLVLTNPYTKTGPVELTVNNQVTTGPRDFEKLPWPSPDSEKDGPPYSFEGQGVPGGAEAGEIPATGNVNILAVPCYPTDMVPPSLNDLQNDIQDIFNDVITFYDQVSYNALSLQVDIVPPVVLLDNSAHYHRANGAAGYPNIDGLVTAQLYAECAQGAADDGQNLDNFHA